MILPAEDIQTARAHIESALYLNADDLASFLQNEIKLGRAITFPIEKRIAVSGKLLSNIIFRKSPQKLIFKIGKNGLLCNTRLQRQQSHISHIKFERCG